MAASNFCWGIEIGAGGIKALKLEAGDNGVNVVDSAFIPHPKVLSTPGIDQNDVVRVSLGTLTSQYDLSKSQIAVSVPGHSAFARFAKLPPVEPKKVPAIVKFEAVQQIPFPLDQVEWDYQTFVSPDSPDVEVGIFAITRDRIMERLTMLQDVGIVPNFVQLSPVAAYNALAYDLGFTDQTPGTIILDVGTTSTDLVVAEAGRVWIRTFPIGGHQFTEALVNQFKLSYPKAEKLKREAEEGTNARHVFQAMRPVFTDLAQDVQRSIGYYQSLHKDAKLVRLIGLGATFSLPGLRKYLKQQLSMDVYRLEEFKRLNVTTLKDQKRETEIKANALQMATAYGLALQGLGLNAITANLMPTQVLRDTMWKGKNKWFAAAAGIAVVAGAGMFLRPGMDYLAIAGNQKPSEIDQAVAEATEQKKKAEEAGVVGGGTTDFRAANMLSLTQARQIHAFLVDDLGQMMAFSEKKAETWKPAGAAGLVKVADGAPKAYLLKTFNTDYKAGGAAEDPQSGTASATPVVNLSALPESLMTQPRVLVRMVVTTTQPDAFNFMRSTLDQWLRDNVKREGVPYMIIANPEKLFGELKEEVAIGLGSDKSVPTSLTVSTPGGVTTIPIGPRGHGGGGGEADGGRGGTRAHGRGEVGESGGDVGEGRSTPALGETGAAPTSADLDRLAPLDTLRPMDPPGKRVTIEISWQVVILPTGVAADAAEAEAPANRAAPESGPKGKGGGN